VQPSARSCDLSGGTGRGAAWDPNAGLSNHWWAEHQPQQKREASRIVATPDIIALIIIGMLAGLTGGMLGIGGSIVMIPAMTEVLGPNQHLYQAAAMIVNFFVVVPAVYHHRKAGAVDTATVVRILPLAILGVIAGVGLSELGVFSGAGEAYLRAIFGTFLLFICVSDLYRLFRRVPGEQDCRTHTHIGWCRAAAVALPTGAVAGLLGVGGGILAVPLQRRFLKIPIRIAIANSATLIIATSFIGASLKNYALTGHNANVTNSFLLAAVLIPTAIVGSLIGSKLTHLLPLKIIKTAFFLILAVAALRLTYKAIQDMPQLQPNPGPTAVRVLPARLLGTQTSTPGLASGLIIQAPSNRYGQGRQPERSRSTVLRHA